MRNPSCIYHSTTLMTHPDCCRFRLASLNNWSNSEILDSRGENPHTLPKKFPQNPAATLPSSTGTETFQPIRDTFVTSYIDTGPSEEHDSQDRDLGPKRTMFFRIRNKKSNSRLHDIARVVRKRMSRESEASKGSSKKNSKFSLKEEDLARRKELRWALHRRLEEELLQDSDDGYDSDAVPILDLASTLAGNDDSNRGDIDQISYLAARLQISPPSSATASQRPSYLPGRARELEVHEGLSHHIFQSQPWPKLHASRSADFAESVLQSPVPRPIRRRSTQNIAIRKTRSLYPTTNIPEAINDYSTRSTVPEKMVTLALDGVNDDCKIRAQYENDGPQISASSSLDVVQKTRQASLLNIIISESSETPVYSNSRTPTFQNHEANSSSTLYSYQGRHISSPGFTHLKVPVAQSYAQRVAASNYSSCDDSFESSRRSSLMKIQSFSERIASIKNNSNNARLVGWSSALDESTVPGTQFAWAEMGETTSASSEAERSHLRQCSNRTSNAGAYKPGDLPLSRAIETSKAGSSPDHLVGRTNGDFCRKGAFSSEPQDINGQDLGHVERADGYTSCKHHGYGQDLIGSVDTAVSSIRDRALRDHAGSDPPLPQTMQVSNEAPTTRKSSDSRTQGGAERKIRPDLQRGLEYTSSDSLQGHPLPNDESDLNRPIAINPYLSGDKTLLINTGTTAAPSWCRYPSHNRVERSFSPAGIADNVVSRDFAIEFGGFGITDEQKETKSPRKKKSRGLTFGKSIVNTLSQIYSIDLRRQHKGHRSSISVGGKLEYPELEILPQLSPSLRPLDVAAQQDITSGPRAMHPITSKQSIVQASYPFQQSINGAKSWSKSYEDCVHNPVDGDERRSGGNTSRILHSRAASDSARNDSNNGELSPHSSGDMRRSTSDFHRSLQDYEAKAKERALQAVDNAWGKSRVIP